MSNEVAAGAENSRPAVGSSHPYGVNVLFRALVERAGLPRVIAAASLARALSRAGVDPKSLDGPSLGRALPDLEETLRVYLDPEEVDAHLDAIRELAVSDAP